MATKHVSFRHVGTHVEDLASGRTVAVGEVVALTTEEQNDPHNQRLLDEGVLIVVEESDTSNEKKEGGN